MTKSESNVARGAMLRRALSDKGIGIREAARRIGGVHMSWIQMRAAGRVEIRIDDVHRCSAAGLLTDDEAAEILAVHG